MSAATDLSPEQELMVALVARQHGREVAERIVRADRVEAYRLGSLLLPPLEQMAATLADLLAAFDALPSVEGSEP